MIADLALRPEAEQLVDQHSSGDGKEARVIFVKCNVVDWKDLNNMFEVADNEFGGADIVSPADSSADS